MTADTNFGVSDVIRLSPSLTSVGVPDILPHK